MNQLSVVLISKNQAWNIARLIESVLAETAWLESCDIILVDSASTDETVEIASRYPIRIIQLSDEQFLCPAAGRFVGYQYVSGKYVLFIDGDNELYPKWLNIAIEILEENEEIAGITGDCVVLPEDATVEQKPDLLQSASTLFHLVNHTGGESLYRRAVLDAVGSFNPFLYSDEEPELALRIRHAGYVLAMTQHPVSYDYTPEEGLISTTLKRWRRNLYLGAGQNLRYLFGTDRFWSYVRERGYGLVPLAGLAVGLLLMISSLILGQAIWFGAWIALILLFLLADGFRKRSLYHSIASFIHRIAIAEGTFRGFFLPCYESHRYQSKHTVVQ